MDLTLDLTLSESPHAGAIAGAVTLGVAVALGLPPLPADRLSRAVAATCARGDAPVALSVRPAPGPGATIALTRGGGDWSEPARAPLTALGAVVAGDTVRLGVSRTALSLVSD